MRLSLLLCRKMWIGCWKCEADSSVGWRSHCTEITSKVCVSRMIRNISYWGHIFLVWWVVMRSRPSPQAEKLLKNSAFRVQRSCKVANIVRNRRCQTNIYLEATSSHERLESIVQSLQDVLMFGAKKRKERAFLNGEPRKGGKERQWFAFWGGFFLFGWLVVWL
jgi:hypothetical protein